jgi:hypothetical protein
VCNFKSPAATAAKVAPCLQLLLAELPGAADVAGKAADCHAGVQGGVLRCEVVCQFVCESGQKVWAPWNCVQGARIEVLDCVNTSWLGTYDRLAELPCAADVAGGPADCHAGAELGVLRM